ncbi:MAG TPA: tetratricopeptide repeat protein [Polyangiales bacterium]
MNSKISLLARAALYALLLGAADSAYASGNCPGGMWASHGSCCELGEEYVASKNQCMPVRPERRCVEGHLDDCVVAGRQLEQRGSIGAGYAAELYRYACDEGHAPACRGLGGLSELGLGVERDAARAQALYEQACAGGDAPACTLLAERMINQHDTSMRAMSLFAQACHRGDAHACGEYGEQLALHPEQLTKSAQYFERACVGGVGDACRTLLEREREANSPSSLRTYELLERGCRAADAESCVELGDAFHGGSIVPQSSARAALSYRSACERGNVTGCERLGDLTAKGDGVAQDIGRASELYARACDAGLQHACERASSLAAQQARKPAARVR